MSLFFETLRIQSKKAANLHYHNLRLNRTIAAHFGTDPKIDLADYIATPEDDRLYRCRITYDNRIREISLAPYTPRRYKRIRLLEADIDYPYKSADRDAIDTLFGMRNGCDDILIVRDGMLTDTSIANIALYDTTAWYTPKHPLLPGTMRAALLDTGMLREKVLTPDDLRKAAGFALLNAMTGFYQLKDITFRF